MGKITRFITWYAGSIEYQRVLKLIKKNIDTNVQKIESNLLTQDVLTHNLYRVEDSKCNIDTLKEFNGLLTAHLEQEKFEFADLKVRVCAALGGKCFISTNILTDHYKSQSNYILASFIH